VKYIEMLSEIDSEFVGEVYYFTDFLGGQVDDIF